MINFCIYKYKGILFVIASLLGTCNLSSAQAYYQVSFENSEYVFKDSVNTVSFLERKIADVQLQGFFKPTVSMHASADTFFYKLDKGAQFEWAYLNKGNIPERFLYGHRFESKFENGSKFSVRQLNQLFKSITLQAENEGFPFARIRLDSITIIDRYIGGVLKYESGPLITFDSLEIRGTRIPNKRWLQSYLSVQQGKIFQQKIYHDIDGKIDRLSFLKLSRPPLVSFQNTEAKITLETEYQKSNILDGVIGFAPGAGIDQGLLITGQVDIGLQNLFRRGHSFDLAWRSVRPETQELQIGYGIIQFLNIPVNLSGSLYFFKQDSTFLNQEWMVTASYMRNRWEYGVYSKVFKTDLQDLEIAEASSEEVKVNSLGITADFLADSQKRYSLSMKFGAGQREVAGQNQKMIQWEGSLDGLAEINFNHSFIRIKPLFQIVYSEQLFRNDLLRVGGINSIRGFPENYFFTRHISILKNEYHWQFDEKSSFFALVDLALLNSINANYAYGTGMGFNLKVNNGIFELIYAVGGTDNSSLTFNNSIIHFGFRSIF